MRVLVACEESQAVTSAFRKLGHEAFSCDIIECSGGHPEWHICQDVLPLLNGSCKFQTVDGVTHEIKNRWDLIVAFPPCTYLTNVATRSHSLNCTPLEKINERTTKRFQAANFFLQFVYADCDRIAIENPVGIMNTCYRKPDQIISPYMFAESTDDEKNYVTKATCIWLKGLPVLKTNNLPKPNNHELFGTLPSGKAKTWEDSLCRAGGLLWLVAKHFRELPKRWQSNGVIFRILPNLLK